MAKEIILDFTEPMEELARSPTYQTLGKKGRKKRKSYPGEAVYQKRHMWWIAHGFGDQAARWAASWRLGRPKKRAPATEREASAIENAIKAGTLRLGKIKILRRKKPDMTEEEIITGLDKKLRLKDRDDKLSAAKIEEDTPLSSKKIESNIYKEGSPD